MNVNIYIYISNTFSTSALLAAQYKQYTYIYIYKYIYTYILQNTFIFRLRENQPKNAFNHIITYSFTHSFTHSIMHSLFVLSSRNNWGSGGRRSLNSSLLSHELQHLLVVLRIRFLECCSGTHNDRSHSAVLSVLS